MLSSAPGNGPRLLFLAADRRRTEVQMAALLPLLWQIIDIARARIEKCALVRQLTELSPALEQRPRERASDPDQANGSQQFCATELARTAEERLRLGGELRQALRRNEFVLHFQPQVSVRTGEIVGVEALLRWRHPDLGLVFSTQFIPLAEDLGTVEAIGTWAMRSACRQVRDWMAEGLPLLRVAVNVSEQETFASPLTERITTTLAETGLAPDLLEVEITEGSLVLHLETAVATVKAVKALGVTLAVDDFGTGYSSLTSLRHFPIDRLKLDGCFIRQVSDDETDQAIARAAVELGHGLKLGVAADGVETPGQLEFLRTNGCDTYQGHLFAAPLPPIECATLLRSVAV
jgi:EAL domain-containing protein (putative c-di-GMP-specific phosphodiesterase class I)